MGEFMAALAEREGIAALTLRFAILTAARPGEVRGMRWVRPLSAGPNDLVLPGGRKTRPLFDMAISEVVRRMNDADEEGTPTPWCDAEGAFGKHFAGLSWNAWCAFQRRLMVGRLPKTRSPLAQIARTATAIVSDDTGVLGVCVGWQLKAANTETVPSAERPSRAHARTALRQGTMCSETYRGS
jgi:hypothetical protein